MRAGERIRRARRAQTSPRAGLPCRSSIDVLLRPVHHAVSLGLDPLLELLVIHMVRAVVAIPADDLREGFLPALYTGLAGGPKHMMSITEISSGTSSSGLIAS